MRRDNPACQLTLVSFSLGDDDVVFLTEVWTSSEEHERARQSPEVQAWLPTCPRLSPVRRRPRRSSSRAARGLAITA